MKEVNYTIAGVTVQLTVDEAVKETERFQPFLDTINRDSDQTYHIVFRENNAVGLEDIAFDYVGSCFAVQNSEIERRYFYPDDHHMDECYAIGHYDLNNKKITVDYKTEGFSHLNETGNSFYHIGWEKILMKEGRLVLHACCMDTSFGGVLFSGVSGIGKSTQGGLWETYEAAHMINGDRPILYQSTNNPDTWMASGSPYAGSSQCYVNQEVPVRAIVMLGQAKCCRIRKLSYADAFRMIYAQLVVCDWDQSYMDRLLVELESLIEAVPVYYMECTPDQRAVELLKCTLEKL